MGLKDQLDGHQPTLGAGAATRRIPSLGFARSGPGKPPEVTDAELVCLAVAQVLLRYDDERHWLRAAPARVGHLITHIHACGVPHGR
jgi:hypothetical protein